MESYIIIFLCLASFVAGFVDAIVGGGGLIQTPIALVLLPSASIASIIGTLKIPGFSGTFMATYHYLKSAKVNWPFFWLWPSFLLGLLIWARVCSMLCKMIS